MNLTDNRRHFKLAFEMSRIYDTPRYEDQRLNKVLLHLDVAKEKFKLDDFNKGYNIHRRMEKNKTFIHRREKRLPILTTNIYEGIEYVTK